MGTRTHSGAVCVRVSPSPGPHGSQGLRWLRCVTTAVLVALCQGQTWPCHQVRRGATLGDGRVPIDASWGDAALGTDVSIPKCGALELLGQPCPRGGSHSTSSPSTPLSAPKATAPQSHCTPLSPWVPSLGSPRQQGWGTAV